MTDFAPHLLPLPPGTPPQLVKCFEREMEKNVVLRENRAGDQAKAREVVLIEIRKSLSSWLDDLVSVKEAAEIRGCCEETIRRQIREKNLKSFRSGERGHHKIRYGDLFRLDGGDRDGYHPVTDAQDGAAPGSLE